MQFEKDEKYIKDYIEKGITRCMKDTFLRHPCRNPQEPDFVAELVNRLPRYIYNTLSVYVPHYKYAISGIILPSETIS